MISKGIPKKKGLYDPSEEHDSCGIGFVAQIRGVKSHDIIHRGLEVLENMSHRGAESADNVTGDGAGILIQLPHSFFLAKGIKIPGEGKYGAGLVFLPQNEKERKSCEQILIDSFVNEGLDVIGFREVPVDNSILGEISRSSEPYIRQVFVTGNYEQDELERKLYIARKQAEKKVREAAFDNREAFYLPSLSTRVMIYKGMFTSHQLRQYYADLRDPRLESAIALIHSRFSTNTFPTWDLAQPFRYLGHNGEINTIKGNRMWMSAREALMETGVMGENLKKNIPGD